MSTGTTPIPVRGRGRWSGRRIRARVRSPLKVLTAPLMILGWATLLGGLFLVVSWFEPIPKPQLSVLSSTYDHPLLAHNKYADDDVSKLGQIENVFDVVQGPSKKQAGLNDLNQIVERIGQQSSSLFGGNRDYVHVVYVNAMGVGLPHADGSGLQPVLIPADLPTEFSGRQPESSAFVSVTTLMERVARLPCSYKLLVLDCQRVDSVLPLGVVQNQFVESVKSVFAEKSTEWDGVFVMCSCSDGEVTWINRASQSSVFGRALRNGFEGFADSTESQPDVDPSGNGDGRITIDELFHYTLNNVRHEVATKHGDQQTPILLTASSTPPEDVIICAVDPNRTPAEEEQQSEREGDEKQDLLEEFKSQWQECFNLRAASPSPLQTSPVMYRRVEEALLAAERELVSGHIAAAKNGLTASRMYLDQLKASDEHSAIHAAINASAFSLPMLDLADQFAESNLIDNPPPTDLTNKTGTPTDSDPKANTKNNSGEAAGDGTPAEPPPSHPTAAAASTDAGAGNESKPSAGEKTPDATASPDADAKKEPANDTPLSKVEIAGLLNDIQQGAATVDDIRKAFARKTKLAALPAEAMLLKMLTETSQSGPAESQDQLDISVLQQSLLLRQLAESAACPVGVWSQVVSRWIRPLADQADQSIRQLEDQRFLGDDRGIPIGELSPLSVDELLEAYASLEAQAAKVKDVIDTDNQTLAEVPYLVNAAVSRGNQQSTPSNTALRETLADTLTANLQNIGALQDIISQIYSAPNHDVNVARRLTLIDQASVIHQHIQNDRNELHAKLLATSMQLVGDHGDQTEISLNTWQTCRLLLQLPFPLSLQHEAEAERRQQLLRLATRPVTGGLPIPLTDQAPNTPDQQAEKEQPQTVKPVVAASRRNKLKYRLVRDYFALLDRSKRSVPNGDQRIADLVRDFFALLDRSSDQRIADFDELPVSQGYSQALFCGYWRAVSTLSADIDLDGREAVFSAALRARLLPPRLIESAFPDYSQWPTHVHNREVLADFLAWHAERRMEDFWAGDRKAANPYFVETAESSLRAATGLSNQSRRFLSLTTRLDQLKGLSDRFLNPGGDGLLVAQPKSALLIGVDGVDQNVVVEPPKEMPAGFASVRLDPGNLALQVARQPSTRVGALNYRLERKSLDGVTGTAFANLTYRGHRCRLPLAVRAVSEVDAPTVIYQAHPNPRSEISVRWSRIERASVHVMFVLDCSRSMNQGNRIGMLRDVLLQFGTAAANSGVNVGVRLFGDRYMWDGRNQRAEQLAKTDSRVILPLQPFPGKKFEQSIREIKARGETPLFHAVSECIQKDFPNTKGEKIVIVISDGADNWASVGVKPGIRELAAAFKSTGVRVNAIGFQTDPVGFEQLTQIAAVTGGQAAQTQKASELLAQVFGLAGIYQLVVKAADSLPVDPPIHAQQLGVADKPIAVKPGDYILNIKRFDGTPIAKRTLTVAPNQKQELLFHGSNLINAPLRLDQDVAAIRDPNTNTLIRILRADYDQERRSLSLQIGLLNELDRSWTPTNLDLKLTPSGGFAPFVIRGLDSSGMLPPNVAGYSFPTWKLELKNWPATATVAQLEASWGEDATQVQMTGSFSNKAGEIAEGARISRIQLATKSQQFMSSLNAPQGQPLGRVSLVLEQPADVSNWSIGIKQPAQWIASATDPASGLYSVFVTAPELEKMPILFRGPRDGGNRKKVTGTISFVLRQIN